MCMAAYRRRDRATQLQPLVSTEHCVPNRLSNESLRAKIRHCAGDMLQEQPVVAELTGRYPIMPNDLDRSSEARQNCMPPWSSAQ